MTQNNKFGYIYKITNLLTKKSYIGQRKYTYNFRDKNYFGSGKILKSSIKKYGKINFIKEIICEVENQEDLNNLEITYIKLHNTLYPNGYNISETPWGGAYLNNHPDSENIKKKISNSLKGFKFSEDRNKRISEAHKGKPRLEETKKKISQTKLNNPHSNTWNKGKKANTKFCIYCTREISYNTYERWHNENCKNKQK